MTCSKSAKASLFSVQISQRSGLFRLGAILVLVFGLAACQHTADRQLESVAKDWSKVIRASQVIPIYPLTADLMPGDVILVPTSINKQTELYKQDGYMPLDHRVTRLMDLPYRQFYAKCGESFKSHQGGAQKVRKCPHWLVGKNLATAPVAGFPSYSFEVTASGGFRAALPIQGVPVGVGFLGASAATANVSLTDAQSYGVDSATAFQTFEDWYASDPRIRETLRDIRAGINEDIFLRVVTRVFLVKKFDVTVTRTDSQSGGVDVGAPQTLNLASVMTEPQKVEAAATAYKSLLAALNESLASQVNDAQGNLLPGVSAKFTQASGRSVSMSHEFDTPVVVGFHGFDVMVFQSGQISPPIPSYAVLTNKTDAKAFKGRIETRFSDWLFQSGNYDKAQEFLTEKNQPVTEPADLISLETEANRAIIEILQQEFQF